jgi:mRNA interferase MazF
VTHYNGEIWLVNFNPSKKNNEMGKVRPAVILQSNELNLSTYPTTIVIPMSTSLIDNSDPIRMRIEKRDELEKDSDIVITQIRSVDNTRLIKRLSSLSDKELVTLKSYFLEIIE